MDYEAISHSNCLYICVLSIDYMNRMFVALAIMHMNLL